MSETVVLLHGFASTHHSWARVQAALDPARYTALAPDIRGHGAAAGLRPITFADCVADVAGAAPDSFTLCGYSLGGRLALHAALALPERVSRLVLVSASAGIEDPAERTRRRDSDERIAKLIERDGLEVFAARWRELPLFSEDPQWVQDEIEQEQLRGDAAGLAAAMRGIGAGSMEPLWSRLSDLAMPVHVIVGERDSRYVELAKRFPTHTVVPGVGHRVLLEAPQAVAAALS